MLHQDCDSSLTGIEPHKKFIITLISSEFYSKAVFDSLDKSHKSHPQLPIDSLQPWSKDSFNFFIFIYLVDALWGQHLYMYKVR